MGDGDRKGNSKGVRQTDTRGGRDRERMGEGEREAGCLCLYVSVSVRLSV